MGARKGRGSEPIDEKRFAFYLGRLFDVLPTTTQAKHEMCPSSHLRVAADTADVDALVAVSAARRSCPVSAAALFVLFDETATTTTIATHKKTFWQ